jgi:capsular polysaccharide transport system permease protein
MNNQSHNWFEAQALSDYGRRNALRRLWYRAAAWRYPLLLILLPTLLVAGYYYLIAADQYESEAHFIVNSEASGGASASGFGALFGFAGGASQNQAMAVPDYLSSHEAVSALSRKLDLVAMFRRPEADVLSRLRKAAPTPEELQRYFEKQVTVHYDSGTGITALTVHAFRPADAHAIASQLLVLSEEQVNRMNLRRYRDAVAQAQAQMSDAQVRVSEIQNSMTAYRQQGRDIDPQATGEVQIGLVSRLKAQLASAEANLAAMSASISPSSPQYAALQRQIRSLRGVIATQSSELTGGNRAIASNLGGYERLRVQQDFAAKNYTAAAAGLIKAQEDANRQQLYIVQVVDPNMPVKALFPKRERIVFVTFLALCVAYGIGWLVLAGVREHAA